MTAEGVGYHAFRWAEDDPSWRERAACKDVDVDVFFPLRGQSCEPALVYCRQCEVRAECLDFALTFKERFGVWGGMSEKQRRIIRRNQLTRKDIR